MKRRFIVFTLALALFLTSQLRADEGMWIPMHIEKLNHAVMQNMGLRLTAEQIYSVNQASLKDAIVGLSAGGAPTGFFCTGEIVSSEGLVFTNHHCAYDMIQSHSTVEFDYLTEGFWAMSREEELPCEGITASILVRMEDVTEIVLAEVTPEMSEADRTAAIRKAMGKLREEHSQDGKYDVAVRSFFAGNEFYMLIYETFKDVRLVGAPPRSIGKFGGDTDNWMWPRHTGDFAVLRIYTAPDGSPATFSEENIPLKPRHYLPISIKGVERNDFTMIYGFPGRTQRYLTSYGVRYNVEHFQPLIVELLGKRLDVMKQHMDADPKVRIQYASDYSSLANVWKYFIGQTRGLKRLDIEARKQELEREFLAWVEQDQARVSLYGDILNQMQKGYQLMETDIMPTMVFNLGVLGSSAALQLATGAAGIYTVLDKEPKNTEALNEAINAMRGMLDDHFKNYDKELDQALFGKGLQIIGTKLGTEWHPAFLTNILRRQGGDFEQFAETAYEKSVFSNRAAIEKFLENPSMRTLKRDPLFVAQKQLREIAQKASGGISAGQGTIAAAERKWIAALREMQPDRVFYPDANSTLRFTYGQVLDYYPADAVHFDYKTTLSGVMEKEDPTNEEFIVIPRLRELYEAKDFGIYGTDGVMYVNFITNHDITGGNSGSPVINANGELVGIAFDGNWEAMSGDIAYETLLQRTISVDIRYVLFVIDKVAGASHLIEEMTIVR
ncbi:MAG TPA: S46 family peptidase [Bacteroidales bacterium]|nr:S46 family peptidase [Bacteroidales bacterium]